MKTYLNVLLNRALSITKDCSCAIEELNDGVSRPPILMAFIESVYSQQALLSAYRLRYPEYFDDKNVNRKYRELMRFSPEFLLRSKISSRVGLCCFSDDLPF